MRLSFTASTEECLDIEDHVTEGTKVIQEETSENDSEEITIVVDKAIDDVDLKVSKHSEVSRGVACDRYITCIDAIPTRNKEDRGKDECTVISVKVDEEQKGVIDIKRSEHKEGPTNHLVQMYTTADWWSLWIGLISFTLAVAMVFVVPYESGSQRAQYVIPQPMTWTKNPFDAWDIYALFGTIILLIFLGSIYMFSLKAMGKLKKRPPLEYVKGFAGLAFVATCSLWIGRQEWCARHGLGYAIFSILFGMIIENSPIAAGDQLAALKLASKDGEYFIKCSLVLLAVEFDVLRKIGDPAIIVAWIGSPLALVAGYWIGFRILKMERQISLIISTGANWCGASAISAIGSIIGSSSNDISLSISIVAAATVIFTFAQPYFAMAVGMDERVAGAWIGGSVDQTGNVVASAAIISGTATEVAGVVKIVLNSALGILAAIIAFWWQTKIPIKIEDATKRQVKLMLIWEKFPKFVLGYILCSGVLSILYPQIKGTPPSGALQRAVSSMNKWWFAIAFAGIGIGTNFKQLKEGAVKSGILKLYLIINTIDICLAWGLAYLAV